MLDLLNVFQEFYEEELHNILHPNQTRWLSLNRSVERIVEQWYILKEFFVRLQPLEGLRCVNVQVLLLTVGFGTNPDTGIYT